jgi:hypothetical protein
MTELGGVENDRGAMGMEGAYRCLIWKEVTVV